MRRRSHQLRWAPQLAGRPVNGPMAPPRRYVALKAGTERAFSGKTVDGSAWDNKRRGVYVGAVGGLPLFSSDAKYDSGELRGPRAAARAQHGARGPWVCAAYLPVQRTRWGAAARAATWSLFVPQAPAGRPSLPPLTRSTWCSWRTAPSPGWGLVWRCWMPAGALRVCARASLGSRLGRGQACAKKRRAPGCGGPTTPSVAACGPAGLPSSSPRSLCPVQRSSFGTRIFGRAPSHGATLLHERGRAAVYSRGRTAAARVAAGKRRRGQSLGGPAGRRQQPAL